MTKIKMVRCTLRSPGEAPAARFVPLREFQLWKYYMTHAHEKIVEGEEISIWVDADSYAEQPPAQARPLEAVVRVDLWWLAIIGVFFSIIGAFYYLRIIKLMYFDEPSEGFERPIGREMAAILGITGAVVIFFVVIVSPVLDGAATAAAALFTG